MRATGLAYGEVIGETDSVQEAAGFVISSVRPVLPPDAVPLHTHVEGAFTFIVSGIQISSAGNASGGCGPGSVIYNPPGTTHRDRFVRNEDGRCLSISVPQTITDSTPLPDAPVRLEHHEALGLARAIARECVCWDGTSPIVAEALCLELVAAAGRSGEAVRAGHAPAWLTQAQELLTDRCTEAMSIASVAADVGVHPAHLARSFTRFFRRSPGEHLRRSRVARAATLLRETHLSLVEIALSCGFTDQSHFSNVFKRLEGTSPAAYRAVQSSYKKGGAAKGHSVPRGH